MGNTCTKVPRHRGEFTAVAGFNIDVPIADGVPSRRAPGAGRRYGDGGSTGISLTGSAPASPSPALRRRFAIDHGRKTEDCSRSGSIVTDEDDASGRDGSCADASPLLPMLPPGRNPLSVPLAPTHPDDSANCSDDTRDKNGADPV